MSCVEKEIHFLKLICNCDKKLKKHLIIGASKKQIHALCEIVLNLLNGNIKLSEKDFEKLSRKRKQLRELIKKSSLKKKKYLVQKGGFIQFLIPAIISGLATIVSSVIQKS